MVENVLGSAASSRPLLPMTKCGEGVIRPHGLACRYWSMYKLPMFGCSDPQQVLTEIGNATKTFPNAYIR